jgi:hypothetical protein
MSCHFESFISIFSLLSNSPRIPISKLLPIAMSYVRNFRPARAGHYLVNYVEGKSINGRACSCGKDGFSIQHFVLLICSRVFLADSHSEVMVLD